LEDLTDGKTAFLALGSIPWREQADGWNVSVVGERLLPAPARIWVTPFNFHLLLIFLKLIMNYLRQHGVCRSPKVKMRFGCEEEVISVFQL